MADPIRIESVQALEADIREWIRNYNDNPRPLPSPEQRFGDDLGDGVPRLCPARSEATNTHLRLLTRRAYGYHSPEALIAMAELTRGGLCPPLPGRS